jgi:CRP-like cAMP-binding protein
MREHAPITIQRMLALRQFPGFGDTDLSELASVADNVVERTFVAGAAVALKDNRVPAIHLLLDGHFEAPASGETWGPRQLFGALEAIAGRAVHDHVIATRETHTLQLATTDFAEILEDNYGVLSTTRRLLARRMLAYDKLAAKKHVPIERVTGPLGMVERLLILSASLPFASGNLQALSTLAQATEELHFAAGSRIQRAGEEPAGPLVVIDGTTTSLHTILAGLETLGEVPYRADVDALTPVRALRLPSAALFDVMEDHTDFAIALLALLAGDLLDQLRARGIN